jgi:murein DD-endopeptidase MepM/ murein hydrolase activator NlpD
MKRAFWVSIALALAAFVLQPLPGLSKPLSKRIEEKRAQVQRKRAREGVLSQTIARYNTRIEGLQGEIGATEARLARVQRSLDRKRAELLRVRNRLEVARDRLERVRRELQTARGVLSARLVEIYKADTPDVLTVVLEADGFADLLERTEFLDRISDQDREIVDRVRVLRDRVKRQADELAALERREALAAEAIMHSRDQIAGARDHLVSSRTELASARGARRAALGRVRRSRAHLEGDLEALEREQARVQATLRAAAPGAFSGGAAGPIRRGSGRLIWPVNGPITGAFGEARPGHMHAGIDISAPGGTPIRAADSGRVVLLGFTGGYGNYTCIQHTASMSTCYAHQSGYATSSGASVRQGQVIGYVGTTGHSFGNHLHFEVRIGGSPVNPLNYL